MACYWAESIKEKIEMLVYALPLHTYALSVPRQSRTENCYGTIMVLISQTYSADLSEIFVADLVYHLQGYISRNVTIIRGKVKQKGSCRLPILIYARLPHLE